MSKTQPARGMRDFLPADIRKREYVIGIIKEVYESYGFEPLETPAVENLETLTGKYGEEGNQLIFKILKRGEKLREELAKFSELTELSESNSANSANSENSVNSLSDLALRYDLTVPLARVVANYKNDLPKFFKRYQIQPVWRADRPARGRFREFYQCDVDAIGSSSMTVEVEQIAAVSEILERLGFDDFVILLNHRDILRGFLEASNIKESDHNEVLVSLDKFDKIGETGVLNELVSKGILAENAGDEFLRQFLEIMKIHLLPTHEIQESRETEEEINNVAILEKLEKFIGKNKSGRWGIDNTKEILSLCSKTRARGRLVLQPILARGLSYYTGAIFEAGLNSSDFKSSIGGGGRYDGLIGMFGKEQIPACGFSLGLERILVVMEERGMFPPEIAASNSADVMVTIWPKESVAESVADSLALAQELRSQGLRVLLYPEADKIGKQLKYAGQINVPYVIVQGDEEKAAGTVALKNMQTGDQEIIKPENVAEKIGRK